MASMDIYGVRLCASAREPETRTSAAPAQAMSQQKYGRQFNVQEEEWYMMIYLNLNPSNLIEAHAQHG